ncbi:MAG: hypothetical protein Q9227_005751 [Pyrenula ochraceoflavens]
MAIVLSDPAEPPDPLGHAILSRHASDFQRQQDPSWLFAPGLLDDPNLKARLRQPRRQLDSYALYISSHVALEGSYVEPSPSPSPTQSRESSPFHEQEQDQISRSPPVEIIGNHSCHDVSPVSLPMEDADLLASTGLASPKPSLAIDIAAIQHADTCKDENDQLPTPRSLSRASTLVDDASQNDKACSTQEEKRVKLRSQRSRSKSKEPRQGKSSKARTHPMVLRSKSRSHRKGHV